MLILFIAITRPTFAAGIDIANKVKKPCATEKKEAGINKKPMFFMPFFTPSMPSYFMLKFNNKIDATKKCIRKANVNGLIPKPLSGFIIYLVAVALML